MLLNTVLLIEPLYAVLLAFEQGGSHEDAHRFLDDHGLADDRLHFEQWQAHGDDESYGAGRAGDAKLDHVFARTLTVRGGQMAAHLRGVEAFQQFHFLDICARIAISIISENLT